jgi:hypothetical protein
MSNTFVVCMGQPASVATGDLAEPSLRDLRTSSDYASVKEIP